MVKSSVMSLNAKINLFRHFDSWWLFYFCLFHVIPHHWPDEMPFISHLSSPNFFFAFDKFIKFHSNTTFAVAHQRLFSMLSLLSEWNWPHLPYRPKFTPIYVSFMNQRHKWMANKTIGWRTKKESEESARERKKIREYESATYFCFIFIREIKIPFPLMI